MKRLLLLTFIGLVIYIPLFPTRLKSEFRLAPAWAVRLDLPSTASGAHDSALPFRGTGTFGYVSPEGVKLFSDRVLSEVALSSFGFINYSQVTSNLILQETDGSIATVIDSRSYPAVFNDRLFLFTTTRASVEERAFDGRLLWERSYASLITAFAANAGSSAIGLLDGRVEIVDRARLNVLHVPISDSRVPVVYGLALGSLASKVGVIHGIDPQYLTVCELKEGVYQKLWEQILPETFRSPRRLWFMPNERGVIVEHETGFYLIAEDGLVSLGHGNPIHVGELTAYRRVAMSVDTGGRREIDLLDTDGRLRLHTEMPKETVYVSIHDDFILVNSDRVLGRLSVVRQ